MRPLPFFLTIPIAAISASVVTSAYGEDYLTVNQVQPILFPQASLFVESVVTLNEEQQAEIKKITGVRQKQTIQRAWRAELNGQLLGWVLVDDVIGKHEFITYATGINLDGSIAAIEILSYREAHGGQVRQAQWRQNFVGKQLQDPLKLDQDIPTISGATLSCRNVTEGVKRMLAIYQLVLRPQ